MEIFITKDEKGGTCHLTTDSPQSHYGIPVLRIDGEDIDGDFGPADIIGTALGLPPGFMQGPLTDSVGNITLRMFEKPSAPDIIYAAEVVAGWAKEPGRTAEEIEAAQLFLRQWPDGPQI